MKKEHVTNLAQLKEQTQKIAELNQQLQEMRSNTLNALKNDNAFNESRKIAYENIKTTPNAVREEIRFMQQIIQLFSKDLLSEEVQKDKLYCRVVMNEHNYFKYWLEHPDLKEVQVNKATMKLLASRTYDLEFPTRIMNCLRALDIDYVFELVDKNPKDFLYYRNLGEKSLKQLVDYVKSIGLDFEYKIRFSEDKQQYFTLIEK